MSGLAQKWAWQVGPEKGLTGTEMLVLARLARFAQDVELHSPYRLSRDPIVIGLAKPKVTTLATGCCLSQKTVRRILPKLEERLLIKRWEQFRHNGQAHDYYALNLGGFMHHEWAQACSDLERLQLQAAHAADQVTTLRNKPPQQLALRSPRPSPVTKTRTK